MGLGNSKGRILKRESNLLSYSQKLNPEDPRKISLEEAVLIRKNAQFKRRSLQQHPR